MLWGPKQSTSATTSLIYITIGALVDVWSTIFLVYLLHKGEPNFVPYLWCYGFLASGLVLAGIGVFVGRIGRAARGAEVAATPPTQVVAPPAATTAAPPVVVPGNGAVQTAPPAPQTPVAAAS